MEMHRSLNNKSHGYIFHSLTNSDMHVVITEMYSLCLLILEKFGKLDIMARKYIKFLDEMCKELDVDVFIYERFAEINKMFTEKYNCDYPVLDFNKMFELTRF
jgi:hypothetical protein